MMHRAQSHLDALYAQSLSFDREFSVKRGIDFCSNDYLSLKAHPQVRERLRAAIDQENALCGTGSRLVSGHSHSITQLESAFAQFVQRPRALFFSSGYQANIATLATIFSQCVLFSDEFNHASIIDGMHIARSDKFVYRHHDLNHLEELLKAPSRAPKAIITESVFSTTGTTIDMNALDFLARKYDALVFIDESHATGIIGKNGSGLLGDYVLSSDHIISTHSCGKALSAFGAFVAGSEKIITTIRNQSRQFICTTAPPPYLVAHVHETLKIIRDDPSHREHLLENVNCARGILATKVPIIAVSIKDDDRAVLIKDLLSQRGFDVAAFRYPSVKKHNAQLRITLHSANTPDEIELLQHEIEALL